MTTLVKNKTRVTLGTVLKIWHGSRGHDYVVVGADPTAREIHLIKHNSINNDGRIHASTSRSYFSHKKLSYNTSGIISKISTVQGHCTRLDVLNLENHFKTTSVCPKSMQNLSLYSTATVDRRDSFIY